MRPGAAIASSDLARLCHFSVVSALPVYFRLTLSSRWQHYGYSDSEFYCAASDSVRSYLADFDDDGAVVEFAAAEFLTKSCHSRRSSNRQMS